MRDVRNYSASLIFFFLIVSFDSLLSFDFDVLKFPDIQPVRLDCFVRSLYAKSYESNN
jgi:hypothetical protein